MKSPIIEAARNFKKEHPNKIILMRVGDFYEMFGEDAESGERIGLSVTTRKDGDKVIKMAGFPHHSLEQWLRKFLNNSFRVAICEQVK